MINRMFNLICSGGHKHWSPTPQAFMGLSCSASMERAAAGGYGLMSRKCVASLRPYDNPHAHERS